MPIARICGFDCYYKFQKAGPGSQTVVFLNGIMSGCEMWDAYTSIAQKLGFSTLVYEYRGQWKSETTAGPYTMDGHREDLLALLDVLEIQQAHFVGTSFGGMLAIPFAAAHQHRVLSLVLIATTAQISPSEHKIVKSWRDAADADDIELLYKRMVPMLFGSRMLAENPDFVSARLEYLKNAVVEYPKVCRGQVLLHDCNFEEMLGDGVIAELCHIACKTLVISGEQDTLYPPSNSQKIMRGIKGAEHVIVADGGHTVVLERPAAVGSLVAGHLWSFCE